MFPASQISNENDIYADTTNLHTHHLDKSIANDQEMTPSPLLLTHISLSLFPQFDSIDRNSSSNDWTMANTPSNVFTTADSVLIQALPLAWAAPQGWHSEIVAPSLDTSSAVETTLINSSTEFVDVAKTSPIMYSSMTKVNPIIHTEQPSTTVLSDKSSKTDDNANQTNEQEVLVDSTEDRRTPPVVIHKQLPNSLATYEQNISVRYLQPPTPLPHGPIIIREVYPPPPPPKSPIRIRQRPKPSVTPPLLVLREKPPPIPPRSPSRIVEKLLPPPPRPSRRMVVERLPACPPKPADVFIERWLPYKRSDQRRIFFERAPVDYIPPQPNVLIVHDRPNVRIQKQFINEGVVRADPQSYLQQHGVELHSRESYLQYADVLDEAARTLQAPSQPIVQTKTNQYQYSENYPPPTPQPQLPPVWERIQPVSTVPPSPMPYHYDNSSKRDNYRYDVYKMNKGDFQTMVDVTPSWKHHCASRSSRFSSSSSYTIPHKTQVNSDQELYQVLSELRNNRVPCSYRS